MENIKLTKIANGESRISEPSGKKIGIKDLKVGQYYFQPAQHNYRLIYRIDDRGVLWYNGLDYGLCSAIHFIRKCTHEATPEEVEVLKQDVERCKKSLKDTNYWEESWEDES